MKPRVTIKDIARETGLSLASVSNIMRGGEMYAEATRKRVWDTAHRLNYVPNRQAQELRHGANPEIKRLNHLIMRINHLGNPSNEDNPFEALRQQIFDWETLQRGFFPTVYWYYREQGFKCPPLIDNLIDGVVLGIPHIEIIKMFHGRLPMVLMDVPTNPSTQNIPSVNVNMRSGFIDAVNRAILLGHRRIALVGSSEKKHFISGDVSFRNDILSSLNFHNIEIPGKQIFCPEISPDTHIAVMNDTADKIAAGVRKKQITLILCVNLSYASTLYELLPQRGIRIPEDVSIISTESGLSSDPQPVTSLCYDWKKIIQQTLDVLVKQIQGDAPDNCTEYLIQPIFNPGKTLAEAKF